MSNYDFPRVEGEISKGLRELGVLFRQNVKMNGRHDHTLELIREEKRALLSKADEFDKEAKKEYRDELHGKFNTTHRAITTLEDAANRKLVRRVMHRASA